MSYCVRFRFLRLFFYVEGVVSITINLCGTLPFVKLINKTVCYSILQFLYFQCSSLLIILPKKFSHKQEKFQKWLYQQKHCFLLLQLPEVQAQMDINWSGCFESQPYLPHTAEGYRGLYSFLSTGIRKYPGSSSETQGPAGMCILWKGKKPHWWTEAPQLQTATSSCDTWDIS